MKELERGFCHLQLQQSKTACIKKTCQQWLGQHWYFKLSAFIIYTTEVFTLGCWMFDCTFIITGFFHVPGFSRTQIPPCIHVPFPWKGMWTHFKFLSTQLRWNTSCSVVIVLQWNRRARWGDRVEKWLFLYPSILSSIQLQHNVFLPHRYCFGLFNQWKQV